MSEFQKPNKNQQISQSLRQFPIVGDDNLERPFEGDGKLSVEEEELIKQARKEKLSPPITQQAKTRLEYLADIGKMTKDIVINGTKFTLRTLKSREQKQVYLTVVDVTNKVDEIYNIKLYTLAHSLIKIDGQDVNFVIKADNLNDKVNMLEQLEETVIDQLYNTYSKLKETSDNQFSIKTEKDMKEVSEELKKS